MSDMSVTLTSVSPRRRRTDRIARGLLAAGTALAIVPLAFVPLLPLLQGPGRIQHRLLHDRSDGPLLRRPGGIKSAIIGTVLIVALATAIAVPIGIGVALYLVEYGKNSRFADAVRYFVDVMTGVPSIVFGLFIYILLILSGNFGGFSGWKGSIALALLMLPVVTRGSEVVLNLVPNSLRESALALGAPRWRVVFRIVLPTALPGLVTASLLAIARAAGETAPLLFTAFAVKATTYNLGQQMNSLPIQIFNDVRQAQDRLVERAWGAALTLVLMILILTLLARLIQRRSRLA